MTGARLEPGLPLALLTPTFWPEVRRGGERIVHQLAAGLAREGLAPRVITSHPGRPGRSREHGYEVLRVWRPPDGWLRRRAWEDHLTHVPFAYAALRRGDDALAHAFHPADGLAAASWAKRTRRPFVLTYLGIPMDMDYLRQRRGRLRALRRCLEAADAVTALSHAAAREFERTLGVRGVRAIHPGVDLDAFSPGGTRAPEPTAFCAAPPDAAMKRVHLLVEAWPHVRRERPDARLVLLRPGDETLAARLSREEGVRLMDPVIEPAELAPAYRGAWVSVLPSLGDSFGLVLAEALACGTPVVGSVHGALPEVVDRDGIGRLFRPDTPEALAAAVLEVFELCQDPATAGRCRARAEEFSEARQLWAHLDLYAELLSR